MLFRTHIAFGFLMGLFFLPFLNPSNQILFILLVAFGAILPDIDHPGSVIGRKVKVIGWIFDHRGFFHSLFAVVLVAAGGFAIFKSSLYAAALAIGYVSHLIGDAVTKDGIAPFSPLLGWRVKGFMRTGHLIEHALFFIIIALSIIKLISF